MLHHESPTEGHQWHHPSGLFGTFDWQQLSFVAPIAQDADEGEINLGLQDSSGSVWFDSLNVTVYKGVPPQRPQPLSNSGLFEEYGWDWTYHAYREWDGWSVEHASNPQDHTPSAEPTDRLKLLLSWFARNEKPRFQRKVQRLS